MVNSDEFGRWRKLPPVPKGMTTMQLSIRGAHVALPVRQLRALCSNGAAASLAVSAAADVAEDDDGRFDRVLADYLAIDDGVVVAGWPSDDEITTDALCDNERGSDEDEDSPCEEPPPRRTAREAAEALVLE